MKWRARLEGEPRGAAHGEPRDDDLSLHGETWKKDGDGSPVCGARRKREGWHRCRNAPKDNGRCHLHGGSSLRGPQHGRYEHGRYSQYLPRGLRQRYERFLADPDLGQLRDELALVDARIGQALQEVQAHLAPDLWHQLRSEYKAYVRAREQDPERAIDHMDNIGTLVDQGARLMDGWDHVAQLVEQRRKLADSENRRVQRAEHTLSAEQAAMLVSTITETVLRVFRKYEVPVAAQQEISDHARTLFTGPTGQA